jgi:hypothetical protein
MSIEPSHRNSFEAIRRENHVTKCDLCRLFTTKVDDQWPLQSRISDFHFLAQMPSRERDRQILEYSYYCWTDVRSCASEVGFSGRYVCCIVFGSDDTDVLWPELFFFNSNLDPLSRLQVGPPCSPFGNYISDLVANLKLPDNACILEETCTDPPHSKIYLDFEPQPAESRITLRSLSGLMRLGRGK